MNLFMVVCSRDGPSGPRNTECCMNISEIRDRAVLTVPEAGAVLGLGRSASYEAARRNEIPVLRLGRRRVVPVPLLLSLLGVSPEREVPLDGHV